MVTQQQKQRIKDLIVSQHNGEDIIMHMLLQTEKRIYQLELINREKNYNQIFNANPCVGVLNPLTSKVRVTNNHQIN